MQTKHLPDRTRAREVARRQNKLVHAMARYLPADVKREWAVKFRGDAETAFASLLRGATHVCPACGFDASPRTESGKIYACGCDRPNHQAVHLFCELNDMVGPASVVQVNFLRAVGAETESELMNLVADGRRLQQMSESELSLETCRDEALQLISDVLKRRPEWRPMVLDRLGSGAEVVETTNGGSDGRDTAQA